MQKRTRRLDKHKTVRYIYLTVKDSIGRSQGPVVAYTMLLILSGRRHWTPKGVFKRGQKQKRLIATTSWPTGLLYTIQINVHSTIYDLVASGHLK
jgi:hypothetical protein